MSAVLDPREELARPEAWPVPVTDVTVHETHISLVFVAGPYAYKVKKPVTLDFLDFSTPEQRRRCCEAEVRLNARLAPDVYLGVVPVSRRAGALVFGEGEEVVDWAVWMRRLPDAACLANRDATPAEVAEIGRVIADFHARAERGSHVREVAGCAARNARDNLSETRDHPKRGLVHPDVHARLSERLEAELARVGPLLAARIARDVPCDTHGDLRREHVYLLDRGVVIVDCVEFSERFRYADPVADIAFLAMDLGFHGRRDLADALVAAWAARSGDEEGLGLLPLFVSYRSAVRAKVRALAGADALARGHWLYALDAIEVPERRPALVLVGGLPGAGKSTLARALPGFEVIRSDVVRKELAGVAGAAPAPFGQGIYGPEWTERAYAACAERAESALFAGKRVIVDASFGAEAQRSRLLEGGLRMGVRTAWLDLSVSPEVARRRIAGRAGDASDADVAIYERARARWEPASEAAERARLPIPADGAPAEVAAAAQAGLRARGIL